MIHARFHGTGATWEICRRLRRFAYEAITLFGPAFQRVQLHNSLVTPCHFRNSGYSSHYPLHATLAGLHIQGLG